MCSLFDIYTNHNILLKYHSNLIILPFLIFFKVKKKFKKGKNNSLLRQHRLGLMKTRQAGPTIFVNHRLIVCVRLREETELILGNSALNLL